MLTLLRLSSLGLAVYTDHATQSLPFKPFEYMAAGLPILSSLRGELETLLRDEQIGRQYEAGDVSSLVEAVHWFEAQPEARKAMGTRAQKLFEDRFSADRVYPAMIDYLVQIANGELGP